MDRVRDIARRGLIFGLPTIDLHRILHDVALDPSSPAFRAPLNALGHSRRLADPTDRSIVAMNVDTPYSYAWLDLRSGPMVLTMPPCAAERYVSAQIVDLYTYIVGYLSPRTTGRDGASVAIAGPSWSGDAIGLEVLRAPTDLALVLIRTQLFDDDDLSDVARLQDAMSVHPLPARAGAADPLSAAPLHSPPPVDVRAAPTPAAFEVLAWMLRLMPVLREHEAVRRDLASIGVSPEPGSRIPEVDRDEVVAGMRDALREIAEHARTVRSSGELFGSREFFAGDDVERATGAFLGILGNAAEEYLGVGYQADAEDRPFDGARRRYTITFSPGGLPPVGAFWSITLYDEHRLLYANPIGRYVLGSGQLPGLVRDADGGLTLDIAHDPPAAGRRANWLPCPAGPFSLAFRTYLPGPEIRDGAWTAPPVVPHEVAAR